MGLGHLVLPRAASIRIVPSGSCAVAGAEPESGRWRPALRRIGALGHPQLTRHNMLWPRAQGGPSSCVDALADIGNRHLLAPLLQRNHNVNECKKFSVSKGFRAFFSVASETEAVYQDRRDTKEGLWARKAAPLKPSSVFARRRSVRRKAWQVRRSPDGNRGMSHNEELHDQAPG